MALLYGVMTWTLLQSIFMNAASPLRDESVFKSKLIPAIIVRRYFQSKKHTQSEEVS